MKIPAGQTGSSGELPTLQSRTPAEDLVGRHAGIALWLIAALYFAGFGASAWGLPLHSDELFSYYLALNSPARILDALAHGADTHPPLHYLALHLGHLLFGPAPFASRLPFLLAGLAAAFFLYDAARQRLDATAGLIAMLFFLMTATTREVYISRPYSLMMLAYALAFWCWQRTADPRKSTWACLGLSLTLAGAVTDHFYGGLLGLAIGGGEVLRCWRERRVRFGVWLALVAGCAPIGLLLPQIRAVSASVGAAMLSSRNLVSSPTPAKLWQAYTTQLNPALPVTFVVGMVLLLPALRRGKRTEPATRNGFAPEELLSAGLMVAMPLLLYVLGLKVTGVFNPGYCYMASIGAALLAAQASFRLGGGAGRWKVLPVAALLLVFLLQQATLAPFWRARPWTRYQVARVLTAAQGQPKPIVVGQLIPFLQLLYYAPEDLRGRLHYLVDVDLAGRYGDASTDVALRELGHWADLPLEDYAAFAARESSFLVYDWGFEPGGWLVPFLREQQERNKRLTIKVVGTSGIQRLLLVTQDKAQ